jgi:D-alanine-D-alanine ligase
MKSVLILCGGQSPEHEISLRSARNVLAALDKKLFLPTLVGIDLNGNWFWLNEIPEGQYLSGGEPVALIPGEQSILKINSGEKIKIDVVFPVLHGPNGEDGSMQGLLQIMNLPYVGPNVIGSVLAMDKDVAKTLLHAAGVPVAKWVCLRKTDKTTYEALRQKLGDTLFVKPANMGSSVGVHKVRNAEEFKDALKDAFQFDHKVVVEEMIVGREVECAVLGYDDLSVTEPGEISTEEEYSFDEKYAETSQAKLDIPAKNLSKETIVQLKQTAHKAMRVLHCDVMSRCDMFLTADGKIYLNEINTLPGFTNISMYPKLLEKNGVPYTTLITRLLDLAVERHGQDGALKRVRL